MSSNPKVTVITSFFNAERFFEEAVESALAQTFDDWELLLVDDGSTDATTEAALRYARQYPQKIRYFSHAGRRNRGISASQNLGISHARGEYIAFLDADDIWLPRKLTEQVAILDSEPEAAMVYGRTEYWYSWTGLPEDIGRDFFPELGVRPQTLFRPPHLLMKLLKGDAAVPCPSDVLVRRAALKTVGGFEEQFRRIFTDQVFYTKLCLNAAVFVSDQCWFRYRKHASSAVSVVEKNGGVRSARLNFLSWVGSYFKEQGVKDKQVWQALKYARWKTRYPRLFRLPSHARYRTNKAKDIVRRIARQTLPASAHRWLRARWHNFR